MPFPLIPNGPYNVFPAATLSLGPGLHLVEELESGRFVGIRKPGYKGKHDFVVALVEVDGRTIVRALSHIQMLDDFHGALSADRTAGLAFVEMAFRVFGGVEPPSLVGPVAGLLHAPDFILKSLKWIWAQEDINYPIPHFQGRTMAGRRLQEVVDGVDLDVVKERAEVKRGRPADLADVDYGRVLRALAGSY